VTVSGKVTTLNGIALTPPITFSGGQVSLGVGTYGIVWTASDGINPSAPVTQAVTISPKIEAKTSFLVLDRSHVSLASGDGAGVLNAGTGETRLSYDATSAGILSVGPVNLLDRAVSGDITSHGAIDVPSTASAGVLHPFAPVSLPALGTLPSFPAPTGGSFDVNSSNSRTIAAGSYGTVNVNSGGTLIVGAGTYYFDTLNIQSNSVVRVAATTRVYVKNGFTFRSSFKLANGSVPPIYLGLATSGNVVLEARYDGTLLAPNAYVSFGVGVGMKFTGSFFARVLEVRPDTTLVCDG
jgi:hypothetical protein